MCRRPRRRTPIDVLKTHAGVFMARALLPKRRGAAPAPLALRLAPARAPAGQLAAYLELTGLAGGDRLPLAWPHVWGFRLHMALLTDPAFPLPIWSALQVRVRMRQLAPLAAGARHALAVQASGMRRLEKGTEADLQCTLRDDADELLWDSFTTFYWRGRGSRRSEAAPHEASSPAVEGGVAAQWTSPQGGGWRFGALTGDYNPLHWSDAYARAFGFMRAFHHPGRIAAQCLARLALDRGEPRKQLELWIKGPVYYGAALVLRRRDDGDGCLFALHVDGDVRPALVGRWLPD